MLLLVLGRNRGFLVTIELFSAGLGHDKGFLGHDKAS